MASFHQVYVLYTYYACYFTLDRKKRLFHHLFHEQERHLVVKFVNNSTLFGISLPRVLMCLRLLNRGRYFQHVQCDDRTLQVFPRSQDQGHVCCSPPRPFHI